MMHKNAHRTSIDDESLPRWHRSTVCGWQVIFTESHNEWSKVTCKDCIGLQGEKDEQNTQGNTTKKPGTPDTD